MTKRLYRELKGDGTQLQPRPQFNDSSGPQYWDLLIDAYVHLTPVVDRSEALGGARGSHAHKDRNLNLVLKEASRLS